jgi:hypothetical protein
MAMPIRELPDHRSAHDHGPFSAYCQVCWYPIYTLWIDKTAHHGACMYGHSRAGDCPEARARAQFSQSVLKIKELIRGGTSD